jgi:hypothetical protein
VALPTGTISMSQVNTELGRSSTATISLNESAVRTLAGVASGAISMNNLRGKSAMSVTASNVSGSAGGFAASGYVYTSGSPNTTVTGGTAPYTYSWAHISTSTGPTPDISGSSIANPTWNALVNESTNSVSTWRVTVTSSGGGSSAQVNITVTLIWTNFE